ncbi:MAG: CheR family methyltransferase [Planctomycetota bacterium]|nr:CheR family methyltransferase [Planctomycetota bacterium]
MSLERVETVLRTWLGIEPKSVGAALFRGAVEHEVERTGAGDLDVYATRIEARGDDAKALARRMLVHETWMFRYPASFQYLARIARERKAGGRLPLRVLCVPCSTGEEPASIAITLADAGLDATDVVLDAFDVSTASVDAARAGWIGAASFRGFDPTSRPDAIQLEHGRYRLAPALRARIRYGVRNILDPLHGDSSERYDVVFCRNLLIYLTRDARRHALEEIARVLDDDGLLFLGHAEVTAALDQGFAAVEAPGAFVCARSTRGAPPPLRVRPAPASAKRPPAVRARRAPVAAAPKQAPAAKAPAPVAPSPTASGLEEARRLADRGYLEPALALLEDEVQAGRVSAAHFHLMAVLHHAGGRTGQADAALGRALYLDPAHYPALVQSALAAEARGDEAAARRFRERAARAEAQGGGDPR